MVRSPSGAMRLLLLVVVLVSAGTARPFAFLQVEKRGLGDVTGGLNRPQAVAVSPDGAHVYVASSGDGALTVFRRDMAPGSLTFGELGFVETKLEGGAGHIHGLRGASGVAVSPDGKHVYASGAIDGTLAVFHRDPVSGALIQIEAQENGVGPVTGLKGASAVAVSPDGEHVYATGATDGTVAVFARDSGTGMLTFVEMQAKSSTNKIRGAAALAVAPDGAQLYVAGHDDDALVAFTRDAGSGKLTHLQNRADGGPIDGVGGARGVAVSADGKNVYVAGSSDNAVATFTRDPATGLLTFLQREKNGTGGVSGLSGASAVVARPDGTRVYATAASDKSLVAFGRGSATGGINEQEVRYDDIDTDGLNGATAVAVSPDGSSIYVAGETDDGVAVFTELAVATTTTSTLRPGRTTTTTIPPSCSPGPLPGCRRTTVSGQALVVLRHRRTADRDALLWRWARGAATSVADFGDPRTTTGYALCVFSAADGPSRLFLSVVAPAGGACRHARCWKARGRRGFRYRDPDLTPDGLAVIALKPGPDGRAAIVVKGRGRRLGLPALPPGPTVNVQLQATTGACWDADYSTALRRTASLFKARAD